MRFVMFVRLALLVALLQGGVGGAWAAAGPWAENDQGRLRLIAAGPQDLGLQFQMAPGWKIYWRSPGDAGFPPNLDWSGSENLAEASLSWPAPHRFSLFGLETFGYGDEVVLPIAIKPGQEGAAVALEAKVDYLTCSDICVPYSETVSLRLPPDMASGGPEAFLLERFSRQVPGDGISLGWELREAHLEGGNEAPVVVARVVASAPFVEPDLIVEGPPAISYGRPEVALNTDGTEATVRVPANLAGYDGVLEGKMLTLTLVDGPRAMETRMVGRFEAEDGAAAGSGEALVPAVSILQILLYALLGGLILNLMPCVLPVLSLKLLSVVKQGGREKRLIRRSFLASAAGILFSFLLLASAAVAVKAAGMAVGWGIQFQQPLFLAFMALLLTFFACNLFGFFEVLLPGNLSTAMAGQGGRGLAGSFATGAFATLLATPCSAPFLGVAVGFALARGAGEIYLVFAALGLGLALPYLLVAALPGLAARLPRPGPWMTHLRRLLGLALAGTAVWILSVLAAQVGTQLAALSALLLALMGLSLWFRARTGDRMMGRLASPVLAGLLALAVLLAPFAGPQVRAREVAESEGAWAPLDLRAVNAAVSAGQVVLVDVTADWCLTCQVNKKLVLDKHEVAERLAGDGVLLQRGDWTSPSEEISDYLATFGRYGIPFNAVYGPAAPDGLALPELLTVEAVLQALDQAGGG